MAIHAAELDPRGQGAYPSGASRGIGSSLERWRAYRPLQRRSDGAMMSPPARLLASGVLLLVLLVGVVGQALGLHDIGTAALSLFLFVGLGAAICLWCGEMSGSSFALYSIAGSLTVTTAVGFLMAQTGLWFPRAALVCGVVAAAGGLLAAGKRDLSRVGYAGVVSCLKKGVTAGPLQVVVALSVAGLAGCAVAALQARRAPQIDGLLGTVGPLWFGGAALLIVAFAIALRTRVSLALPVLSAASMVILSQAAMYGAPTVMAAARHIGLVEFIRVAGSLGNSRDIYQAWPGMFAGSAWVIDGAGISDPLTLATWWPVLITPVTVLAVRVLAGRLIGSTRAWVAAGIFGLGDAVNSTYFSPQALGFLLVMAAVALVLASPSDQKSRARFVRFAALGAMSLVIVISHQISPFMMAFALLALVLFRLVEPWWLPLVPTVPAILWAAMHYSVLERYIDLSAIGSIFVNVAPPEHPDPVAGIAAVTKLAFYVPAAALVVFGVLGLVAVGRQRDRVRLGLLAAMVSPIALAFGTNYGQEGVFRVVLFAVPWLAILVAGSISRLSARVKATLVAAMLTMTGVNAYGLSALDWARVMRPEDASAVAYYETHAPDGATLLSLGTKNATPARITARYDMIGYTSRDRLGGFPVGVGEAYSPDADLATVTAAYVRSASKAHYAIISDAIGAYDDRYGLQRFSDFERLEKAMASSPEWTPVFHTATSTVYRLSIEPVVGQGHVG